METPDKKTMMDLNIVDPLKRNAEKDQGLDNMEDSPMDPPSAYEKKVELDIDRETAPEVIREFAEDHDNAKKKLDEFEKALATFKENGYVIDDELNNAFSAFFRFIDEGIIPHNSREEKYLFPILQKRLIESGEHSENAEKTTAIDLLEDDHVKFIQLGTLVFNLLGLAPRLSDRTSGMQVMDIAYQNAKELVELLRLHIFREDHTLFPLAIQLLTAEDIELIEKWKN